MESDLEYISDEEEYKPRETKKNQEEKSIHTTNQMSNNTNNNRIGPYNLNSGHNVKYENRQSQRNNMQNKQKYTNYNNRNQSPYFNAKPIKYNSTTNNPEKYDIIKKKILDCFNDAVIIPMMNITIIYSEKYTTMFDYKNGGCLKGVFHNHKTVQKYFACCMDTFKLVDLKMMFIQRSDKNILEKTQRRIDQHINKVAKNSPDKLMHIEILILSLFASKTTLQIEDLAELFYTVYRIKLESLLPPNRPVLKSIQLINSPNMQVSITHKSSNVICIPPSHSEFHHYRDKIENYQRVLSIEDKICRPTYAQHQVLNKTEKPENKIVVETPLIKLFKGVDLSEVSQKSENKNEPGELPEEKITDQVDRLLSLANLNIPKSIQKTDVSFPSPSKLYSKTSEDQFLYCLQSLKLDENEAVPLTKSGRKEKKSENKE